MTRPKHLLHLCLLWHRIPSSIDRLFADRALYHALWPIASEDIADYPEVPIWIVGGYTSRQQPGIPASAVLYRWFDHFAGSRHLNLRTVPAGEDVETSLFEFDRALNDRTATVVIYCDWAAQDRVRIIASRLFPNSIVKPMMIDRNIWLALGRRFANWCLLPRMSLTWYRHRLLRPLVYTAPAR